MDDELTTRLLGPEDERPVDARAALERFRARTSASGASAFRRGAPAWSRPAAAAAGLVLMFGLVAATGVAETLLTVFQPRQVAPVAVERSDLAGLPDLTAYGTLTWQTRPAYREAPTVAEAAARTGITPLRPSSLPAGVTGDARIYTVSRGDATFAFDESRLRAAAAKTGRTPPPMPAAVASSTLRVAGGPAVVQTWGGSFSPETTPQTVPTLLFAQSRAPVVTSNGATVDELRAYLLAQPDISPRLAAQVRAIGDPTGTLLIPIPVDLASGKVVAVRGVSGVFVGDSTGLGSAVFWVAADGIVHVVAGTLGERELIAVANALR